VAFASVMLAESLPLTHQMQKTFRKSVRMYGVIICTALCVIELLFLCDDKDAAAPQV